MERKLKSGPREIFGWGPAHTNAADGLVKPFLLVVLLISILLLVLLFIGSVHAPLVLTLTNTVLCSLTGFFCCGYCQGEVQFDETAVYGVRCNLVRHPCIYFMIALVFSMIGTFYSVFYLQVVPSEQTILAFIQTMWTNE